MNAPLTTIETMRALLGWCAIGNLALLLVWFGAFFLAHDLMHAWHGRWFKLSRESFDAIHYIGMAIYKILIWMLFIIPYLVLRLAF
ncbi:MAG: hypothetical protein LBI48_00455 [Burkholderiaceae bacterium]|jgi:hypothetical protein|nr:hypothetical protein [Burkholderiaceae bacterium]